jgi:hypothetical protein
MGLIDVQLLPEDDQDRLKHVGVYDKSCVKTYIILTLVHFLVLLSELFNCLILPTYFRDISSSNLGLTVH